MSEHKSGAALRRPPVGKRLIALYTTMLALLLTGAAPAAAEEPTTAVTIPGTPLTVYVGPLGQCQSSYANLEFNFFSPSVQIGDCGLFLAFPPTASRSGQPAALAEKTYGFSGSAGPNLPSHYQFVERSAVSGTGSEASPYTQTTVFKVVAGVSEGETEKEVEFARVSDTTTYINGQPQFTSSYTVENTSGGPLYFRAIYAGDLYVAGSDYGVGLFLGGPPRFVGGQNPSVGVIGGFIEAPAPAPPWSAFEEGCWNATPEGRCEGAATTDAGIWHLVREAATLSVGSEGEQHLFNNTIDPALIDNGVGVEWDEHLNTALAKGGKVTYTIINRTQVPGTLQIAPANQTLVQGQTAAINVTSLDTAGQPYAGKVLRYTISGANPQSGAVTLNASGQAQIAYVGNNAGIDTIQMYVDLAGNGTQQSSDPAGTASVTFTPRPPTPNSSYTVQAIHANANGTITITFVPTQSGQATLEVTVPTGTIARRDALLARISRHRAKQGRGHHLKRCSAGKIKIKRRCLPRTTVVGKTSANGTAGQPLTISVHLAGKALSALRKGKTIHALATLTYRSALGGTPTVSTYHLTIKPKRSARRGHRGGKHRH